MLPLLGLAQDGKEDSIGDVFALLGKHFGLSEAEMAEMLPSGRQPLFYNRVHWAKTYLSQAKLLETTKRGHFRITERGQKVLREHPSRIDVQFLERFPQFK